MKRTKTKILSVFLSFCMIISCMVGMSVTAQAAEKSVTFTSNGTQDGITVSAKLYARNNFFANNTRNVTISSGSGNITKLEITDSAMYTGRFTESHIVVTPGTKSIQGSILTVTDINAKSVTLSATDNQYWTTNKIVVYYEEVTGPDKTALNDAITAAETLYNSIKDNTDYADIASTLQTAINTANGVAESNEVDQDAIDDATEAITSAKTTAETALFNAYKNEQKTAAQNKAQTGDSAAATKLITDAKNAIDALTYDTSKTLDQNKAAVTNVITKLTTDLENQRAADAVITKINALPTTVTTANKDAIEEARADYEALTPDQKALVSADILAKLTAAEEALVTAQNKAAFDAYKTEQKTAAENKAQTGDSDAAAALITAAKDAIDDITYDTSKTLDENKAAVTAVVTQLTTDLTDQRAADAVIEKINALPTTVTTADKNAIKEAREAYDGLTPAQKAKISDTIKNKLEAAETAVVAAEFNEYKEAQKTAAENKAQTGDSEAAAALITAAKDAIDDITYDTSKTLADNKAAVDAVITKLTTDLTDQRAADAVIEKINALPTTVTTADKDDIEAAREAYDALTPAQKEKVGDAADKLSEAETALSEAQVKEATDKINDLPDADKVTASDKEDIEAAREAYDALTPDQKAQAGDAAKAKLEAVEAALAIAELPAASDVTTTDKTAIEAARAKYDALTDDQKSQVGDAAKAKLEAVEAALLIAQLPESDAVTTGNKDAIEKAREAYDALTDTLKAQVGDTLKEKLEAAEVALTKKLIEAIPDPADVTTADADKVAAAKTAYDKLTDDQKTKITEAEKEKLDAAVQALSDAETSDVEALIRALPSASSVTTADAEAIEAAKEAFDELTEAQKAIVKATLKDKLAADLAALAIAKLPAADNVTAADKDAIEAARAAYDALTSTQKSSVGEAAKAKLEAAEAKIQDAVDTEAAKAVIDKINALPASTAVTANDKADIEAARAAYDALTDNQKAKIDTDTLKKLTDAEAAIQDAEDKAAADAVKEMIDALPGADDVTVSDKAAIEAARAAYNALTDNQKAKVSADTLKKLTDAEDALALAESEDKLDKTISSATAYYDSIKNRYPAIAGTLKNAIDAAQAVLDDEDAEKADIDAAVTALNTAVSTARTAVSYAGGGSSTPSYVPSYSPSNTSTTTTTTANAPDETMTFEGEETISHTNLLSWSSVSGASSYLISVKKDGKFVPLATTTKTNIDVVHAYNGKYYVSEGGKYTAYTYKDGKFVKGGTITAAQADKLVKANNVTDTYMLQYTKNGKLSSDKTALTVSVKVYYKPAVKASSKDGKVILKWKKVVGAEKYRVYKYEGGKLVKVADTTANAVRISKVTAGKTYKYAVKAYVDGKWTKVTKSDIVSVKVK